MKPNLDLPRGVVTCLSTITLAGVHLAPGDTLPAELWTKIPAKNRAALLGNGVVTLDPGEVGDAARPAPQGT
jgi:hypothetical protein